MNQYELSILVLTYNPNYNKLITTLKSFLLQKSISLEIVVSDDGSEIDYFNEIRAFFAEEKFVDYKLIKNKKNQGTVKNILAGVRECSAEYVKTLSPGDYIVGQTTLRDWLDFTIIGNYSVVGSDYYCYSYDNFGNLSPIVYPVHPVVIPRTQHELRMNYILHDDIFCGAAVLVKKVALEKYLALIENYVYYAEDNVYRVMAYCGEPMAFYNQKTVLYEVGTGISTNNDDGWKKILQKDWLAADMIMKRINIADKQLQRQFVLKILLEAKIHNDRNQFLRKIFKPILCGQILFYIKRKLKPRYSPSKIPAKFLSF